MQRSLGASPETEPGLQDIGTHAALVVSSPLPAFVHPAQTALSSSNCKPESSGSTFFARLPLVRPRSSPGAKLPALKWFAARSADSSSLGNNAADPSVSTRAATFSPVGPSTGGTRRSGARLLDPSVSIPQKDLDLKEAPAREHSGSDRLSSHERITADRPSRVCSSSNFHPGSPEVSTTRTESR